MVGDFVIVRQFGGIPIVRRVVDSHGEAVYITTDEQLDLFMGGKIDILSIGFPRRDVFKYDQRTVDAINNGEDWSWNDLSQWGA